MALRDRILAADIPREPVDELDGTKLYVRGLTGREKGEWSTRVGPDGTFKATPNFMAEFLVQVLVDEDGARVFTDEDAEALGSTSAAVLEEWFTAGMRLSAMTEEANEELDRDLAPSQSEPSTIG